MPEYKTVEEFRDAQDKDWSQYVAVAPVLYDGVIAANVGDAVPASHPLVSQWVGDGVVKKVSTKAAQAVTQKDA